MQSARNKKTDQVAPHPLVGSIFENMVVMEAVKSRLSQGEGDGLYFMRTSYGTEVDLVVENAGRLDLCEIKAGATFHDDMANNIRAIEKIMPGEVGRKIVVYSGRDASTADGIEVKSFIDGSGLGCRLRQSGIDREEKGCG